jgi:hypothetical protein
VLTPNPQLRRTFKPRGFAVLLAKPSKWAR